MAEARKESSPVPCWYRAPGRISAGTGVGLSVPWGGNAAGLFPKPGTSAGGSLGWEGPITSGSIPRFEDDTKGVVC